MRFFNNFFRPNNHQEDLGKSLQMSISFNSVVDRGIIQQAIADKAELTGETRGAVASNILRSALISADDNEAWIYESALYDAARNAPIDCYPDNVGIGGSLETAFDILSCGIDEKPAHPYGLPYVQFATAMCRENNLTIHHRIETESDPRVNLTRDFDSVVEILTKNGVKVPKHITELIEGNDEQLIYPVFEFILNNWSILGNYSATYHFLVYLIASTENWKDTAAQRTRLKSVCTEVSRDVQIWKEEKMAQAEKNRRDATLVNIPLANGDSVDVPRSWIQIDPNMAACSSYAGAVEIKNPGVKDTPHFVFFLKHPVYEMTETERIAIERQSVKLWPPLAEILSQKIELEYGPDGGITNYQEYLNAPKIGFFSIMEESEINHFNTPPYGAVIKRSGASH